MAQDAYIFQRSDATGVDARPHLAEVAVQGP
jgi:hypothetical protein